MSSWICLLTCVHVCFFCWCVLFPYWNLREKVRPVIFSWCVRTCDGRYMFWLLCFVLLISNRCVRCSIAATVILYLSLGGGIDCVLRSTPGAALTRTIRDGSSTKAQVSSATNTACISNSNVTYLVSCWPPWTVEEGDIASFFVKDLGLALAPEMCPDQSQAFKEVNHSQTFTVRRKLITTFSEREASRCSKACFYKVSCKYSKNWRRRTNIR